MDQNNYNGQGVPNDQTREPLPTFDYQQQPVNQQPAYQQPVYQQPVYQQPVYQQPVYQQPATQNIEENAGKAFGKSLAATIMAWFPVTSIIAIIMGAIGLKLSKANSEHASRLGVSAGGKNNAAKILGIVGLVSGIVMTVFWFIYIILIAALADAATSYSSSYSGGYYYY